MADMDFVEGVGESSSPPRTFGGFSAVHDIRNDVYTRLVQCGHEEAVSNPQFRENLDAHFNRLPPRFLVFRFCLIFVVPLCLILSCFNRVSVNVFEPFLDNL